MTRVLADYHHTDLYHSLQLLFEKRLQFELYHPVGLDWFNKGFWNLAQPYNNALDTLKQQLWVEYIKTNNSINFIEDPFHTPSIPRRGITLEQFKQTEFDIIVASVPEQLPAFQDLQKKYQQKAKVVFQAGNNWGGIETINLLNSTKGTYSTINNNNTVFYHQEFSLERFYPGSCDNRCSITTLQHYSPFVSSLREIEQKLNNWTINYYGAGLEKGAVDPTQLGNVIRNSGFIWHPKKNEGYGFNIHNSFACGRPMIVDYERLKNSTAGDLFIPNETIIDYPSSRLNGTIKVLNKMIDNYDYYTNKVYTRFKEVVDFDQEEEKIRLFISNLRD
jgi:hypothetical protein